MIDYLIFAVSQLYIILNQKDTIVCSIGKLIHVVTLGDKA